MKIGHKLILSYFLVALLASFTTYTALHSYGNVDAAVLNHEYEQTASGQINARTAISNSASALYPLTFLTFLLTVCFGVYISRMMDGRIIKFKEASEKVGHGEFETQIEIRGDDETGNQSNSFNKMLSDLKNSRSEASAANDFTEKMLNSMVDFVVVTDMDLTISRVNKAALKLTGYNEFELIGKPGSILSGDNSFSPKTLKILRKKGNIENLDKIILNKDGSLTPISMSVSILKDEHGLELGVVCVGKNVTERIRQEQERRAIAAIVHSVFTAADLNELFKITHQTISKILYAENCFIALYNQTTGLINFEFWADKFDQAPPPLPPGNSFSSYILRTGQSVLLTRELENQMYESGEVEQTGADSPSWMGVPLSIGKRTIGVLAVQHYEKENVYSARDLELLAIIGDHLALAIERKQNLLKLKASETQLNEAQRVAKLGSWQWDALTNKVTWSDEMYRIFGFEPQEIEPTVKNFFGRLPTRDRRQMLRITEKTFDDKLVSSLDHQIIRPDGTVLTLQSNGKAIADKSGRVIKMVGTCQDITERKEAEKKLRVSEEQHRLLFETNPQPSYVYDVETLKFLAVNEAAVRHYGYSRKEFLNDLTLKDIRPPEDIPYLLERVYRAAPEKDIILSPSRHKKKDGTIRDVEVSAHMVVFDGRRAEIVLVNDVTERKKLEEKLRENESQFRDLFDNAPIAYHELDSNGHFTRINKTEELMLGYTNEELKGRHPAEIIVEEFSREAVAEKLAGKHKLEPAERTFIRKDGTFVPVLSTDYLIYDSDGKVAGIRTTLQDITERKKLEQELRAREESYRAFVENSTEGIWRFDFDVPLPVDISVREQIDCAVRHAYLAECNNAMAQMYGFDSAEDLINMRLSDLLVLSDETNSEYFSEFVKNKYRLNDAETHEKNKLGEDKYFLNNMVGIFEKNRLVSAWGTQRDVTERRKAEETLKIYNQKLQQSNRELQDFAYIASHDLQEPLRKVQAFADRLSTKYADKLDETGLDYLERMRSAAGRMQTLIQDLLSFSRVTTKAQPFAPVDLEKITREVLSDLEVKIEETGARVEIEKLPELDADPSQMRQLMQNLIGNALKFHRKDTAPIVKISAEPTDNYSNGNGAHAHFCQITVSDNGIGFDEKYLDKIFTVFQRLHGRTEYEGSGVGLAVCRKIVERHGGNITARSTLGEGASFVFTLPFKQPKTEAN